VTLGHGADGGSTSAPLSFPRIQRSTLQAQVADAMEELIVMGALAPGERLTEASLAARLGVSRQPVREALHSLASLGFVDLSPMRGATVHAPTMREIREVFHVRAILEADSCALAARTISEVGVKQLDAICTEADAVLADRDTQRLIELNGRFHRTITRIGGNNAAFELLDRLQRRIAWYLTQVVVERAPDSWVEHREILAALADADADEVHRRMLEHVHRSVEAIELHQR
jgi:DNA-binding GntR family transcriptional regulator